MGLIRKLMIETRNRIEDRKEKNRAIEEIFFRFIDEKRPETKRLFIYASAGSEADTKKIIEEAFSRGIHVFCPRVIGVRHMEFFEILSLADLQPGFHGIPEPDVLESGKTIEELIAEKAVYPEDAPEDLMLIPGVVFDEEGGRMGYGGGFYDRYLSTHSVYKLALAFEVQVRPRALLLKQQDVRMDALITEEKLRVFREG